MPWDRAAILNAWFGELMVMLLEFPPSWFSVTSSSLESVRLLLRLYLRKDLFSARRALDLRVSSSSLLSLFFFLRGSARLSRLCLDPPLRERERERQREREVTEEGPVVRNVLITNNGGFVLPRGERQILDRETERQRQRQRERERERERSRSRSRSRSRERERDRDRETERQRDRETERQRQTERQRYLAW